MVKLPSPPQTATLYNLTRIVFKFINSPKLLHTLVSTVLFLISNFKKMNNDRVDDHCYSFVRFNDVGSSMTPSFLLMDHFHYRFSTKKKKNEENLSKSLNFLPNASSNSILFSSLFIRCDGFKWLLKG